MFWCQVSSTLKQTYRLVQDFLVMVHQREGQRLDAWLAQVAASGLSELQSFAAGVEQDKEAVQAGLISPLSNAQTEGKVTKVKLIKRSMYGKAGFARLSPTAAACWVKGDQRSSDALVVDPDGSKIKAHCPIAISIYKGALYIKPDTLLKNPAQAAEGAGVKATS